MPAPDWPPGASATLPFAVLRLPEADTMCLSSLATTSIDPIFNEKLGDYHSPVSVTDCLPAMHHAESKRATQRDVAVHGGNFFGPRDPSQMRRSGIRTAAILKPDGLATRKKLKTAMLADVPEAENEEEEETSDGTGTSDDTKDDLLAAAMQGVGLVLASPQACLGWRSAARIPARKPRRSPLDGIRLEGLAAE